MPELPEVETMVRGVRPHAEQGRLAELKSLPSPCRPITITPKLPRIRQTLIGQIVTAVGRRGKRIVFHFASGHHLVMEPRMTGLLLTADPPDQKHLRMELEFEFPAHRFERIWFWDQRGLGTVSLFQPGELESSLKLGPDALEVSLDGWRAISQKTSRPVKVALLDQSLVAGIGNLYASEILHLARISPSLPFKHLTRPQIDRLHQTTQYVLEEAIRYEGSTLGDGTYRNTLNQSGGYQNAHRVYDREGEICPTCGKSNVVRIVQSQRSTFYCPKCQP